ncbi:MAG: hypothetical protein U0354_20050 [Candidatus Sericytochromatia bacterium]
MTPAHIHLMINHLPLFTGLMGICLLIYSLITKNKSFEKLYLILFIFSALSIIPTYFSGDRSEEVVEHIKGVSESLIHPHEEMAEKALALTIFLGILSLWKLFMKSEDKLSKIIANLIIVSSFISLGLIGNTAYLGGQIRHSEIRSDSNMSLENEKSNESDDEKSEKEEKEEKGEKD